MSKNREIKDFTDKLRSATFAGRATSAQIKIFADGANKETMLRYYGDPRISGFTTNPTLMRKAGIADYETFAHDILAVIKDRPISFEVFSDDFAEMEKQAHAIGSWADNTYVKIPITNTKGETSLPLIKRLSQARIKLNITAITLYEQVAQVVPILSECTGSIVSVFAGRIADAGQDPVPVMKKCLKLLNKYPSIELLWASPRELYNLVQAENIGCHIITLTEDILKKLPLLGGDLQQVSLDTVRMFYNDAQAASYRIKNIEALSKLIK